jgi:aspartate dehydrogenase
MIPSGSKISRNKKEVRIGVVGCGAIGRSLAGIIHEQLKGRMRVCGLYDLRPENAVLLARRLGIKPQAVAIDLRGLIRKSDLVVEAASAGDSFKIAAECLRAGRSVMVMSVGGIVKKAVYLSRLASKTGTRIFVPSGAIAGIDALKAASGASIKSVILTTRKNPLSFSKVAYLRSKGIVPERIKKDTLLFEGSAEQAVKLFPQNINVAAVLSLAGIGEKKTLVRIVASPKAKNNIHEIEIISDAARITARTENTLHPDNPKTSYLAVLAAAAVLKQMIVPLRVGT